MTIEVTQLSLIMLNLGLTIGILMAVFLLARKCQGQ